MKNYLDQIRFFFLTLLSVIVSLSCHLIFVGPKYKNSKFCDFLALYSQNQLVNNFGLKIINFQRLAFNGLEDDYMRWGGLFSVCSWQILKCYYMWHFIPVENSADSIIPINPAGTKFLEMATVYTKINKHGYVRW